VLVDLGLRSGGLDLDGRGAPDLRVEPDATAEVAQLEDDVGALERVEPEA